MNNLQVRLSGLRTQCTVLVLYDRVRPTLNYAV